MGECFEMNGPSADADTQPGTAKTVADILTAAADLIEPEGRWTQGTYARRRDGLPVITSSSEAVCYCLVGAVATIERDYHTYVAALSVVEHVVDSGSNLGGWNDNPKRTQAEVVAALRAAAEEARTASSVGTDGRTATGSEA